MVITLKKQFQKKREKKKVKKLRQLHRKQQLQQRERAGGRAAPPEGDAALGRGLLVGGRRHAEARRAQPEGQALRRAPQRREAAPQPYESQRLPERLDGLRGVAEGAPQSAGFEGRHDDDGTPRIFIRAITELEKYIETVFAEGTKKLKENKAKAFNTLRSKVRKGNKDYAQQVEQCKSNPAAFESANEEEEEEIGRAHV